MALLNSSSTTSMTGGANGVGPLNSTAYLDNDKTLSSFMMSHHANQTLMNNTPVVGGLTAGNNVQPSNGHSRNNTLSNVSQFANSIVFTPQIRIKHTGDFLGYLEWKPEDEPLIIKRLIDGKFLSLIS
jgi:hypothetical protein